MLQKKSYNHIAGQSVERLAALSDGIFAVAMTLLVLNLHTPETQAVHSEQQLWQAMVALMPQLIMFAMSFLTLGIFWTGQQTQLNHIAHTDRHLTWIHIAFLFGISMIPFSTQLLASFITYRLALVIYWINMLVLGLILYGSWRYAIGAKLMKGDILPIVDHLIRRRILIAQILYAFAASLCIIDPYFSIGFIVALQVYYAVAPTFRGLKKS